MQKILFCGQQTLKIHIQGYLTNSFQRVKVTHERYITSLHICPLLLSIVDSKLQRKHDDVEAKDQNNPIGLWPSCCNINQKTCCTSRWERPSHGAARRGVWRRWQPELIYPRNPHWSISAAPGPDRSHAEQSVSRSRLANAFGRRWLSISSLCYFW